MKNLKTITAVFTTLSMMLVMSVSHATTYSFYDVKDDSGVDVSAQLFAEVTEYGSNALIKLTNDVDSGEQSSITDIYFGYDNLLTGVSFFADSDVGAETNVVFTDGANPGNLSGGTFTADYSTDADPGSKNATLKSNGVNATGESISFLVSLGNSFNYTALMNAINNGSFNIGLHVQAITDSDISDSYEVVSAVPVPAAAWLFGTALFGFAAATRRKKNS